MKITFKYYGLATLITAAFFAFMQWVGGNRFGDPDAFYHARVAELLWHGKITTHFDWLALTTWGQAYADQHYLYHLLLYPFSDINALKISVVIFSTAAFVGFIYLLRQLGVKFAGLWLVFLLSSSVDFLFRVDQIKANTLSLLLLFMAIALLVKKHYRWLAPLSFIFVGVYGGFVFLPLIVAAFCLADYLKTREWNGQPIVFCVLGIGLGLFLHPHFPHIITQLYNQIFRAGLGLKHGVFVGQEWYPYTLSGFLKSNAFLGGLWLLGVVVFGWRVFKNKAAGASEIALFLVSVLFLVLTLKSRRFIEYWAPFAILFSAVVLSPYLQEVTWPRVKTALRSYWEFAFAFLLFVVAASSLIYANVDAGVRYFQNGTPADSYKGAAQWLAAHSAPGEVVFNSQWDEFPQLFYWNTHNRYILGMDPMFMYIKNPKLYWNWRKVSEDKPGVFQSDRELRDLLVGDFNARYVFLENSRNPNLKDYLDASPQFVKVYSDKVASVYQVE